MEAVAQARVRQQTQPAYDGEVAGYVIGSDPEAAAITGTPKAGAREAIANCAYIEYGVGFIREDDKELSWASG